MKKAKSSKKSENEALKYEVAKKLGLSEKVEKLGWGYLTAEETGRIGGIMTRIKRQKNRYE